jgi:nitrite reductase (NAD(P)H)
MEVGLKLLSRKKCPFTFRKFRGVVEDPERRKQFRQFVNTVGINSSLSGTRYSSFYQDERVPQIEQIEERGQPRPADWARNFPPVKFRDTDISAPKEQWKWRKVAKVQDLMPTDAGTTSAAVKYGDSQIAIFHIPKRGYFATQQVSHQHSISIKV